jgi:hypothetical protein
MRHFTLINEGIDVAPVLAELAVHPELWGQHSGRQTFDGSAHTQVSDIWVRFRDLNEVAPGDFAALSDKHIPINYPAWDKLPSIKPIVFELMATVRGEMLGGILITKIPAGASIAPHADDSWHVQQYDKFYVSLQSEPGARFHCIDGPEVETLQPKPGECWLFDNRKVHSVTNRSGTDRVTLIVCIRTEMFGRLKEMH